MERIVDSLETDKNLLMKMNEELLHLSSQRSTSGRQVRNKLLNIIL